MHQKHLITITVIILLALAGTASAADYYVSTTGSNSASGDITHPWQNVSYAAAHTLSPGDTVHLFDGTWYSESMNPTCSGTLGNPITFCAYNGTPTLDGVDKTGYGIDLLGGEDYINITGLTITRYSTGIFTRESDGLHTKDCHIHNMGASGVYYADVEGGSIHNNTVHDIGWNNIFVAIKRTTAGNVSITNNRAYDNPGISGGSGHNLIDLYNDYVSTPYSAPEMHDITIEYNILYNCVGHDAIFEHGECLTMQRINISHNIVHDCAAMRVSNLRNSLVHNNTIYDQTKYGIQSWTRTDDTTFTENTIYNCLYADVEMRISDGGEVWWDDNNIGYYRMYYGTGTIEDETQKTYDVHSRASGTSIVEYSNGRVFDRVVGAGTGSCSVVEYYPTKSNFTLIANTDMICTVTSYNITLDPTNAYLKNVTVNHESDASDDRTNVTVNSSVETNPTTITATMQNSTNTYNVSVDGVYVTQVVTTTGKVATYQYSSSWSSHHFEFDWFSDTGFTGAATPTNLQSTTGSTWVHHTWQAGSGNITDSYNVSKNSVWDNSSSSAYWNQTSMAGGAYSSIVVWAWNNTGGISQNSVSQNIQNSGGGSWAPSIFGSYYNVANPILITTKGYGDESNLFNRTPTQTDGNATTSGKLGVTI